MSANATLETGLCAYLKADSGISAIVFARIFPEAAVPEGADTPYLTFERSNQGETGRHLRGAGSLRESFYRFVCRGSTALVSQQLGDALRAALDDYDGTWTVGEAAVYVRAIYVDDDNSNSQPPIDAGQFGPNAVLVTAAIWHE